MTPDYPKVRYGLEALPVEHGGRRLVLLRDRMGYSDDSLLISPQLAVLLMQMNGQNSLRDLQAYHMRVTGQLLFLENLQQILQQLDQHLFLENERFLNLVAQEQARFELDPVRRMQHAGKSYPLEPDSLRAKLASFFPDGFSGETRLPSAPQEITGNRELVGLVAPHIDLQVGGECFALAYKAASESICPRTWVILGTGHEIIENYFALTPKDFETPLGLVRHDRDCCEELLRAIPRDIRVAEYSHKKEHSIEFQCVFLAYTQPNALIVPLLCSFSHEDWERDETFIDQVVDALKGLAERPDRPVGFIASVDLAHIGPRYGDAFKPHAGTVADHLSSDRDLLKCLENCDAAAFMGILRREQNRRRICGLASLYVLARVLEGRSLGSVLCHTHAAVDQDNSFVTFASMAFYEKK